MIGWILISSFFLALTILGVVLYKLYDEDLAIFIGIFSFVIMFISVFITLGSAFDAKKKVVEFNIRKSYYENLPYISEFDLKKIKEDNNWLLSAKASYKGYGIFSFYNENVEKLEFIEYPDHIVNAESKTVIKVEK